MKHLIPFLFVLLFFVWLLKPSDEFFAKWSNQYEGPFPSVAPAGYCLVTDGEVYSFTFYDKALGKRRTPMMTSKRRTYVIDYMWSWIESDRKHRHQINVPPQARVWRPVNPELCKTEK